MLRFFKINIQTYCNSSLLSSNNICQMIRCNYFKSQTKLFSVDTLNTEESDEKKKKKKTIRIPEVKLIYPDESVTINILDEARKIARRQGYQLVKMSYTDIKNNRDIYRLCTVKDFVDKRKHENSDGFTKSLKLKSTKLISIKSKIAQNDLQTKVNQINNLLRKRHKIKVLLIFTPDSKEKRELSQFVEKNVKGNMVTQNVKDTIIIMIFHPLLNDNKNTTESIGDILQ